MVCFSLFQLIHKNSILHYKAVKIKINESNFAKVISNRIVYYHDFLNLAITIETLFNIVIHHYNLSGSVITNNDAFYPLITCYCYVIFYALDAILLLCLI